MSQPIKEDKESSNSPLLFCQEAIHQEILELQKRAPSYLEYRDKKKPEQYHEETKEERRQIEAGILVIAALFGFIVPYFIAILLSPENIGADNKISFYYIILYFGMVAIFLWLDYKRSKKLGKWNGYVFIQELVCCCGLSGLISTLILFVVTFIFL